MKKNLFLVALATMSLVSCSNDEVMEVKQDVISFDVVANNGSRASVIYSNSNKPTTFQLTAIYDDGKGNKSVYIEDETITLKDGVYKFADNQDRYWPATGSLTFYAVVEPIDFVKIESLGYFSKPSYLKNIVEETTDDKKDYNVNIIISQPGHSSQSSDETKGVADQHDLIYAVKANQTKVDNGSGPVTLNFRHALSQIVFNAKNTNPKLHIVVEEIGFRNVDTGIGLTLPKSSTDGLITAENASQASPYFLWPSQRSANSNNINSVVYYNNPFYINVKPSEEQKVVVNNTEHILTSGATAMLLPPQKQSAATDHIELNYGTLLNVTYKVYNIAGETYNEDTDVLAYEGTKNIPISLEWEQGKKYTYTLLFEPDVPLSFALTVDDFVDGGNNDVYLNK